MNGYFEIKVIFTVILPKSIGIKNYFKSFLLKTYAYYAVEYLNYEHKYLT